MNNRKLEQDHPCVLKLIRLKFLELPASRDVPYNLSNPLIPGTYEGVGDVDHVLKNKVNT